MAFSKGKESSNGGGSFSRYVGVGSVKVLAVNPNMEEWNTITGGNMTKEPEYIGVTQDGVKTARITLLVQTDPAKTIGGIDTIIPVTFWFRKMAVVGSQSGKYQVIDKYGQTAWATAEEIEAKKIPQYTSGPANIDADYRKVCKGEVEFTDFLRAHLNIASPRVYNRTKGMWEPNAHLEECEARLDGIGKIFDGDFSEIKKILAYQKENHSKMLFGVRTTDDGKEYQDVFMGAFLTNGSNNYAYLAKKLKESTDLGQYSHTYFGDLNTNGEIITSELREYIVPASTVEPSQAEMPDTFKAPDDKDDLPF